MKNQHVILVSRPTGWVTPENFKLVDADMPVPANNQVLIRNQWLSLDPYMRGRISDAKSYAQGVNPGEVMVGGAIGEVNFVLIQLQLGAPTKLVGCAMSDSSKN